MRKLLIGILLFALAGSAWAQQQSGTVPAGAQVIFPVDNFPVNGPSGAYGPQSCSAACANTTLLGPIDTTGYSGISLQMLSVGGGATITTQQSNDPTCSTAANWLSLGSIQDDAQQVNGSGSASPYVLTVNAAPQNRRLAISGHCFRAQITAYTSGTITAQASLRFAGTGPIPIWGGVSVINIASCAYPGNCTTSGIGSSTPITATATGTTAALAITLPGVAAKTTYICGYTLSADATAATEGAATITGTISGTMNFRQSVAALANGTATAQQTFTPCIPASAVNTAIVVNSVAAGAGGNAAGYAWGFQL